MIVLLIFISSCAFGGSSPVNAESIACVHGQQQDGACVCENCWTGLYCDEKVQLEFPEDEVRVPLDRVIHDNIIFRANALGDGAVCDDVHYSLIAGNDHGHFSINSASGQVRVSKDVRDSAVPMPREDHILIIQARRLESERLKATMTLRVLPRTSSLLPERLFDFPGEDVVAGASYQHHHHVHKRRIETDGDS
ncbi:hypothetical protein ACOMHN_026087 [Nucella lapillus]